MDINQSYEITGVQRDGYVWNHDVATEDVNNRLQERSLGEQEQIPFAQKPWQTFRSVPTKQVYCPTTTLLGNHDLGTAVTLSDDTALRFGAFHTRFVPSSTSELYPPGFSVSSLDAVLEGREGNWFQHTRTELRQPVKKTGPK